MGLGTAAETVGEATSAATSAVKGAAGRAISGAMRPITESAAQPELQTGIRQTASKVAQEAEVAAPKTPSMYKTVEEVGNNVYAKSKSQYAQLDAATGGRVQRFKDRLENIREELNSLTGTEEDVQKEAKLLKAQKEIEDGMAQAFEDAKANGVDPNLINNASSNFKQSQALFDLDTAIQRSTSGKPVGVGRQGLPETVDPKKLAPRITALWKSGRLQQALGEEHATDLMDYAGEAAQHQQTAIRNKMILKIGLPVLGVLGVGVKHYLSAIE